MAAMFQRLTRPIIRRLASGGTITEHGITFERLANGDGVFTVNIMVEGQRIHRVIGRESAGTTRTQAEEFIEKVRRDAREGRLNLPKGRKIALGFREAATRYLEKLAEEGGKDLVMKRRRLRLHLMPFFGDTPLSQISTFDVERYKKSRVGEGAKVGTVNRELAALSHLFTKGLEWGWINKRPAKMKRYAEERGRIIYLTIDQIKRLLEAAQHDQNPQVYPFMVIGLETSMRRMEILSIRREHIDTQRRVIYLPTAKAGDREQPMTAHLATFLEAYIAALPEGTPWLFPSVAAQCGHTVEIRKPFRRVVRAAGLNPDEVVRHTLRHTAITHLVQAGVDLPTVKRISGHKTLLMVERYAHQNGAHIQAAMDALEARYTGHPLPTAQRR
jgi:integrase